MKGRLKRINLMLDSATLQATDRVIAEVQRKCGQKLSRSEVVRAICCGVGEALRTLDMGFPALESGDELRATLVAWIVEAEQGSRKLEQIHTSTLAGGRQ